ncbi:Uncharacterised protein [Segatella copri]|nr:Uncharacterised protein [Segatella copri]
MFIEYISFVTIYPFLDAIEIVAKKISQVALGDLFPSFDNFFCFFFAYTCHLS